MDRQSIEQQVAPARSGRPHKRRLSNAEREQRRVRARKEREAERRSLAVLHDLPMEPRIDPATLRARRAEMPDEDTRDLTARVFGDPNPADQRRRATR